MNLASKLWWLPLGSVPEVSAEELRGWLKSGKPLQLADARTLVEYQQGTIGIARHAPLTEMPRSMKRLELDTSVPVVVLCLSGHRSLPGVRWLRARGYQAFSLRGGVGAWKRAGYGLKKPR